MAGAIVGAHVGERGFPAEWIKQLEDGLRGRLFARELAEKLFDTWRKIHKADSG